MHDPRVSVIVVSRGRPDALIRCLTGLAQLRYAPFEIVVVTDPAGRAALVRWPHAGHIKIRDCDEANISVARNLGLMAAAGEIVAFIDDDAVPEPGWLAHLTGAFQDPEVGAAGGYVRGRNGISWQWTAQSVDRFGRARALGIPGDSPVKFQPRADRATKTEGTNMAFRRSVIASLGGFDPNYRYFLDETDVNLRFARAGVTTALVPRAVVHHGYEENRTRRRDRVPRDLSELGASWAVFLRRYVDDPQRERRWKDIVAQERRRALRYMISGHLEPRDVRALVSGLHSGYAAGASRTVSDLAPLPEADQDFLPFPFDPDRPVIALSAWRWSQRQIIKHATDHVRAGRIVSVCVFSPTSLFHTRRFDLPGFWLQKGGIFGKSLRTDATFRLWGFASRSRREQDLWKTYQ